MSLAFEKKRNRYVVVIPRTVCNQIEYHDTWKGSNRNKRGDHSICKLKKGFSAWIKKLLLKIVHSIKTMSYNVSHDKLMPPCILATEFVQAQRKLWGRMGFVPTKFCRKMASFNTIIGKNCTMFVLFYVIKCLKVILVPTKFKNVPMGL